MDPRFRDDAGTSWHIEIASSDTEVFKIDPRLTLNTPAGIELQFRFVRGNKDTSDGSAALVGDLCIWMGDAGKEVTDDDIVATGLRSRSSERIELKHFTMFRRSQGIPLADVAQVAFGLSLNLNVGNRVKDQFEDLFLRHTLQAFFFLHKVKAKISLVDAMDKTRGVQIVLQFERTDQVFHTFTFVLPWAKAKKALVANDTIAA